MKVAMLSSNLLARKGTAQPSPAAVQSPQLTSVHRAPQANGNGRESKERVRISLRLDPDRHRRLRLTAAHLDKPLQDLLVAALDHYLDRLDLNCACVKQCAGSRHGEAHQCEEDESS